MLRLPLFAFLLSMAAFEAIWGGSFYSNSAKLAHDFALTGTGLLEGANWMRSNGLLESLWSPPWFTPAWCAGSAYYADPQAAYYAPMQWLAFALDPFLAAHISALLFAAIAFWGSYATARKILGWETPSSTIFAVLGVANALMPLRSAAGQTGYHSFYLWTVLVLALAWPGSPKGWRKALPPAAVAAALTGWLQFGFGATLVPASLGVLAFVSVLIAIGRANWSHVIARGALGVAGAAALNASKVYESASLLRNFPRDFYAMPGFPNFGDAALAVVMALTQPSEWTGLFGARRMEHIVYMALPHEWALEFGLGSVALCLLSLCALLATRIRSKDKSVALNLTAAPSPSAVVGWAIALIVVTIPLMLLWSSPSAQALIKSIPILSSTTWPMRWIIVYVPLAQWVVALPVAAALRLCSPKLKTVAALAGCALIWAGPASESLNYYKSTESQAYDPRGVARAHAELVESGKPIPVRNLVSNFTRTGKLTHDRNDLFLTGASPIECYNPLYGYRLEAFPQHRRLREGPALGLDANGRSLLMNPSCLVHPQANSCSPGDGFDMSTSAGRGAAEAFMNRGPFEWRRGRVGEALSLLSTCSWMLAMGLVAAALAAWIRAAMTPRDPS